MSLSNTHDRNEEKRKAFFESIGKLVYLDPRTNFKGDIKVKEITSLYNLEMQGEETIRFEGAGIAELSPSGTIEVSFGGICVKGKHFYSSYVAPNGSEAMKDLQKLSSSSYLCEFYTKEEILT